MTTSVPSSLREPAEGSVSSTLPSTSSDFTCVQRTVKPLRSSSWVASAWDFPTTSGTVRPPQSSIWYVTATAAAAKTRTAARATRAFLGKRRRVPGASPARNSRRPAEVPPSTGGISIVSPERHALAGGT